MWADKEKGGPFLQPCIPLHLNVKRFVTQFLRCLCALVGPYEFVLVLAKTLVKESGAFNELKLVFDQFPNKEELEKKCFNGLAPENSKMIGWRGNQYGRIISDGDLGLLVKKNDRYRVKFVPSESSSNPSSPEVKEKGVTTCSRNASCCVDCIFILQRRGHC